MPTYIENLEGITELFPSVMPMLASQYGKGQEEMEED